MYLVDADHVRNEHQSVSNGTDECEEEQPSKQQHKTKYIHLDLFNPISKIIGIRKNMAATDGQIILAASRFGDTPPVHLR